MKSTYLNWSKEVKPQSVIFPLIQIISCLFYHNFVQNEYFRKIFSAKQQECFFLKCAMSHCYSFISRGNKRQCRFL